MIALDKKKLKQNIEARIYDDMRCGKVGGAAIIVMQHGKELFRGYYSTEELGIKIDENTIFRLASMTKPITTAAVMILVDRGLLDVNDAVSKYLPEYAVMNVGGLDENKNIKILRQAKQEITIRHLLTHTSGLGCEEVGMVERNNMTADQRKNLKNAVEYYSNMALAFEPGEREAYSGVFAFDVLARIVELISGMPYDQFLQKEIFGPLGMTDTTFTPSQEQWARMIPMHSRMAEENVIVDMPQGCIFGNFPVTHFGGGAGLVSTPRDYLKFAQMLQQKGKFEEHQIISEKMIDEMSKRQLPDNVGKWGFGVRVVKEGMDANLPGGAYGWSGAYGTHFWVDPTNGIVGLYFKNSLYDGGGEAVTSQNFEQDVYQSINLDEV